MKNKVHEKGFLNTVLTDEQIANKKKKSKKTSTSKAHIDLHGTKHEWLIYSLNWNNARNGNNRADKFDLQYI